MFDTHFVLKLRPSSMKTKQYIFLLLMQCVYINLANATQQGVFDSDQYSSYLNLPHLHFKGNFIANVATGNNDIRNYNTDTFMPHHILEKQEGGKGSWNPKGTNDFLLSNCKVTSACYHNGTCASDNHHDTVIGQTVGDAGHSSPSIMVDVDPQGQFVTEIYGLKLGIESIFEADMVPIPLQYFWMRQIHKKGDIGAGGGYQSVLKNIKWFEGAEKSTFFKQLRNGMEKINSKELSIRFYLDLFINHHIKMNFTKGRIIGTIGLSGPKSPTVSTWGRILMAQNMQKYHDSQFILDKVNKWLIFDFGNSFPLDNFGFPLIKNIGDLVIAYPTTSKLPKLRNCTNDYVVLGKIPYRNRTWIQDYAAIQLIQLNDNQIKILEDRPLAVLEIQRNSSICKAVIMKEFDDGINIRPVDTWVFRRESGEPIRLKVFATKFGRPLAGAKVKLYIPQQFPFGTRAKCCTPALNLPKKLVITNKNGLAEIAFETPVLNTPRKYIDGQVYAIGYYVKDSKLQTLLEKYLFGIDYLIIVRVYDHITYKSPPNWVENIYPIFKQYANLYPVMKSHTFDLTNYYDVVAHKDITKLSINLPITDPNLMPSTRDLSKRKRRMINEWLDQENPLTGDIHKLFTLTHLKELLQTATEIEHSTIPAYLTALWSIRNGYNREIHQIIKVIIRQEMLHMALAANILNAVGGKPSFRHSTFLPKYPSRLPGDIDPLLIVSTEKLSRSLLKNVFIEIEKPEKKLHHLQFRRSLFGHMLEFHHKHICKLFKRQNYKCHKARDYNNKDLPDYPSLFNDKNSCHKILKDFTSKITKQSQSEHSFVEKQLFEHKDSIGAFYNQILLTLAYLTDCGLNNSIFTGDPKRQVLTKGSRYGNGQLFGVHNYFDAVRAIQVILEEGQGTSPCDPKIHYYKNVEDLSHYGLFNSIVHGHRIKVLKSLKEKPKTKKYADDFKTNDDDVMKRNYSQICKGGYRFSGPNIPYREKAVWPILSNAKKANYPKNSNAAIFIKTFNRLYNRLLASLEESFNGNTKAFVNAKFLMYSIDYYGRQIVRMPIDPNGNPFVGPNAAPTFEWIKSSDKILGMDTPDSADKSSRLPTSTKTAESSAKENELASELRKLLPKEKTSEEVTVDSDNVETDESETDSNRSSQKLSDMEGKKYDRDAHVMKHAHNKKDSEHLKHSVHHKTHSNKNQYHNARVEHGNQQKDNERDKHRAHEAQRDYKENELMREKISESDRDDEFDRESDRDDEFDSASDRDDAGKLLEEGPVQRKSYEDDDDNDDNDDDNGDRDLKREFIHERAPIRERVPIREDDIREQNYFEDSNEDSNIETLSELKDMEINIEGQRRTMQDQSTYKKQLNNFYREAEDGNDDTETQDRTDRYPSKDDFDFVDPSEFDDR